MATIEASSDSNDFEYRPLSSGAIASGVFGVLSMLTFAAASKDLPSCLALCPIPLVGLIVGFKALSRIRAMPTQLSGSKIAYAGVTLSAIGLVGGLSYAGYVHATEVPTGYVRTSFHEFRPDEVEVRSGIVVPEDVQDLEGLKVFIKGYIRPQTTKTKTGTPVGRNASQFLLVRDSNECCFGDQSKVKYYDQVLVTMAGARTADDSRRLMRLGGTLKSIPANLRRGPSYPVYMLEVDYLQ